MRLKATAGRPHGFFHEAAFYGSDDEFLAIMIPFLTGGIEAGEPAVVVVNEGNYEAAFNHVFAEFPAWVICPYDTRIAPPEVLVDVARTHPHVATTDGRHVVSSDFEDPVEFLTGRPAGGADPLESTPPMTDLIDPTLSGARRAVRNASHASRLDDAEVADFVWAVTDRGRGPTDPLVGLLPTGYTSPADLGLWLTHQICSHVTHGRNDDGFTIRLVAGVPSLTT